MSNWSMLNTETGEIRDINEYHEAQRNRANGYIDKQAREDWQGRQPDFTASVMRHINEVSAVLTTAQCGYLMRLQCNVGYDDGLLVNTNKSPMTKRDMMTVLQLTRKKSTFYDFFKACLDHDIIRENDGLFHINTRYHFKGAFDEQFVIKSYTAKIKRVYREVKATDIGLIYRMLPYVHYETNTLCDNPYEVTPEQVRPFNRKQLAEAIGVDAPVISKRLPRMTFDGEFVIATVTVGGKRSYMFNPWVFYRKDSEPDATLRRIFNVKA